MAGAECLITAAGLLGDNGNIFILHPPSLEMIRAALVGTHEGGFN